MQYGLSTALHSLHTTGAYGSTGISGMGLHGVHTAPKGSTTRVASIRDEGHAFHDRRTPSFFSSSAKSMAIAPASPRRHASDERDRRGRAWGGSARRWGSSRVRAAAGNDKRRPIELEHPSGLGFVVDRARVGGRWLAESRGGQSQSLAAFTGSHSRSPPPPPPPRPFVLMPARRVLQVKGSEPMQHGSPRRQGRCERRVAPLDERASPRAKLSRLRLRLSPADPPVPQREILPLAHRRRDSPPHFHQWHAEPSRRVPFRLALPLVSSVGGYPHDGGAM